MYNNLYHPMTRIMRELNHHFNNMPRYVEEARNTARAYAPTVNVEFNRNVILSPRVDALESDTAITLYIELPGVGKDDMNVSVTKNVLTIKGEKKRGEVGENVKFIVKGRRFGQFERSFDVPESIDAANIVASFENGVLTLVLPKKEQEQPNTVNVEIQ